MLIEGRPDFLISEHVQTAEDLSHLNLPYFGLLEGWVVLNNSTTSVSVHDSLTN